MLDVIDLAVNYGSMRALDGVSLFANKGEIVAIVGGNGAGKSTLLKAIAGLVRPQRGKIALEGASVIGASPSQMLARGVVLVPQYQRVFPSLTVRENLRVGEARFPDDDFRSSLGILAALAKKMDLLAGHLSWGEQQMLGLARAMGLTPKLLLLDEPSLGLRACVVKEIYGEVFKLNRRGVTVLITEHNKAVVSQTATQIFYMRDGKLELHDGTPQTTVVRQTHED